MAPYAPTSATRAFPSPAAVLIVIAAASLAVLFMALLLSAQHAGGAVTFEEDPVDISKVTVGKQSGVDLAIGPEDRLYAVWEDGRLAAWQGGSAIFFALSEPDERGRAFSDAIRLPALGEDVEQFSPSIAVGTDGVIHVAWHQRSRGTDVTGGPYWEVHYTRSRDGGYTWMDPIRISQPNNRNNTDPDVAALAGDKAYVGWEMDKYPGRALTLALVEQGSRKWFREDIGASTDRWERNGDLCLATTTSGLLHAVWASSDLDGGGSVIESQIFYLLLGSPTKDSVLSAPSALADDPLNWTHRGPSLALTKRHGVWVTWVRESPSALGSPTAHFMSDRVLETGPGEDLPVAELVMSSRARPLAAAVGGAGETVLVVISGVGSPTAPPMFTQVCSEFGCFAAPEPAVPPGTTRGHNASISSDSLGNVYIAWDDGLDAFLTQRSNSPPGQPELLQPDRYTHLASPEFMWTFNDPDAGSSQSAFEVEYSTDSLFMQGTMGGVVLGVQGRSAWYTPTDPLDEGRWFWRVRTRDELGLWSPWSTTGEFLADRTTPSGTVLINSGNEYVHDLVVVLTLNATDLPVEPGNRILYQISNDPNFANASTHEYPPPNHQVNHELPPGEGVKVVFMRLQDASGWSFTTMDTVIYNSTPFIISHTDIVDAPADKPLNVTCEVVRWNGVSLTLYYRRVGKETYEELPMESNGSRYWAVIPKDDVTLKGVEYHLKAVSKAGTVTYPASKPAEDPVSVTVYETTEQYHPPIYSPTLTLLGAAIVAIVMFSVWFFRIRD
jgi:hypothetical protein